MDSLQKSKAMEEKVLNALGVEKAFDELCRALTTDQRIELFSYIGRTWDIDFDLDE